MTGVSVLMNRPGDGSHTCYFSSFSSKHTSMATKSSQNTNIVQRRAGVSLRVVVVGGSISGLGTALALQRAGHYVIVAEQSDGKKRVCSFTALTKFGLLNFLSRVLGILRTFSKSITKERALSPYQVPAKLHTGATPLGISAATGETGRLLHDL